MIYFRNNGEEREKYEITFDDDALDALILRIAKNCGELRIVKKECKRAYIPNGNYLHKDEDDVYHFYDEIHYKESGNMGTEWDHYDEYEVPLYYCDYKDYACPKLVNFIYKIMYGEKDAISKLFKQDFKGINKFPTVKEKIDILREEIAKASLNYSTRRQKRMTELNQRYSEMNSQPVDLDKQLKELHSWINKTKKELLEMDKKYSEKQKELNDRLNYLLSIEKLNEHQEDVSKYIIELLSLIEIKLVDKISLAEIKRVREFQSEKVTTLEEGKCLVKE